MTLEFANYAERHQPTMDSIAKACAEMQHQCTMQSKPDFDCLVILRTTWEKMIKEFGEMVVDVYAINRFRGLDVYVVEDAKDVYPKFWELKVIGKRNPMIIDG